jgi:beta-galactosidase/beta-glucuronidase
MSPPPDYPRPDFDRSHRWLSLNGAWDFAADPDDRGRGAGWERGHGPWPERISVPFAWESPLSGVGRAWLPIGWYRRSIARPVEWAGERTILHIGAAHYQCMVWLNGRPIGAHTGGYLPFSFDITDALEDGRGELVLRVEAPIDKRSIPHGKQRSRPADDYDSCAFTASSGVWQPVWLEGRPATHIAGVELRPSARLDAIHARVTLAGPHRAAATLSLQVAGHDAWAVSVGDNPVVTATLPVRDPYLWTPRTPHLYDVVVRLRSADGEDRVGAYTGLRRIETRGERLLLNGERLYVRGVLDQGYWPAGGYTAPDDMALRRDVELTRAAGYNLARKHIKLEDPRWLYWADRLGLLVWAEPPCVGRYSPEAIARFEAQLEPMVARDGNHPCIVLWGIYNEEWGLDFRLARDREKQEAVERAYAGLKALDRSRPIIDNSGWWHVETDLLDWHYYDNDVRRWGEVTAALVADATTRWQSFQFDIAPFVGMQLSVAGKEHAGLPLINGEYGGGRTTAERGWHLRWQTQELRRHDAVGGYLYCELYDVEHELCGIYSADRAPKDLGCDPAAINAETVIIFDLVPDGPGRDVIAPDGAIDVAVRLSHHGLRPLQGTLTWAWEGAGRLAGKESVTARPYELTAPLRMRCSLPGGHSHGRLEVLLSDAEGRPAASGFLDVTTSGAGTDAGRTDEGYALSERDLPQATAMTATAAPTRE